MLPTSGDLQLERQGIKFQCLTIKMEPFPKIKPRKVCNSPESLKKIYTILGFYYKICEKQTLSENSL